MTNGKDERSTIDRTRLVVDLFLVSGLGLGLIAIHYWGSDALKRVLTFYYTDVNVWGLFGSAFVQHTDLQLWGNLTAFLVTIYLSYLLVTEVNYQRWFRPTFTALVFVLPPLVTISSYLIYTHAYGLTLPPERGFSGVASGFGGFLFVALIIYLRNSIDRELANSVGLSIMLFLLVEIHYFQSGGPDGIVIALASVGILLMFGYYVWENRASLPDLQFTIDGLRTAMLTLIAVIVLATLMRGMFPADFLEGDSFTNIIGHGMGFIWGAVISAATLNWILSDRDGRVRKKFGILAF